MSDYNSGVVGEKGWGKMLQFSDIGYSCTFQTECSKFQCNFVPNFFQKWGFRPQILLKLRQTTIDYYILA